MNAEALTHQALELGARLYHSGGTARLEFTGEQWDAFCARLDTVTPQDQGD